MPKASQPKLPLEVSLMYEPHRQQHSLLREAYAQLLAEARRSISGKGALDRHERTAAVYAERKSA